MKKVTLHLPDSVNLSESELEKLLLQKLSEQKSGSWSASEIASGIAVPANDVTEIRHLIGLYYAEKATRLVDELWEGNGWTAETMHGWVREHMRTPYHRGSAA